MCVSYVYLIATPAGCSIQHSTLNIQSNCSVIIALFCYLLSLSIAGCTSKTGDETTAKITKEEVRVFIEAYDAAWHRKNDKAVDSLYSPQYRYFTSVGGVSSRARNLEILAADYYNLTAAERTEIDITIDGNVAIVSSRWKGNGIWQGEPFNDNQRCGLVIQKKGAELKLLTEHCVDISTEPSF